jgi:hypothetical protein
VPGLVQQVDAMGNMTVLRPTSMNRAQRRACTESAGKEMMMLTDVIELRRM